MRDVLPGRIVDTIKEHLRSRAAAVQAAVWESSNQDEDSLTGDFFGNLRTRARTESVEGRTYSWSVGYKKIRGRGPGAPERLTGADGIFEVEVEDLKTGVLTRKALPFQAKKRWEQRDGTLVEQVRTLEDLAEGASGVFDYSPNGFTALDGKEVLSNDGRPADGRLSAGEYLGRVVECESGSRHVFFDAVRGLVIVKDKATRMRISHRLRVTVDKH